MRKRDEYAANPDKERCRMAKEAGTRTPRRRQHYHDNLEQERKRKRRSNDLSATDCLKDHNEDVLYGPQFACIICNTHTFLENVVPETEVEALQTGTGRRNFIDLAFVQENPHMFVQLDRYHVCLTCLKSVENNEIPSAASVNRLPCTWSSVPEDFLSLSQHELECVALTRLFFSIENLQDGLSGKNPELTKTMLLPATTPVDAIWLQQLRGDNELGWPHNYVGGERPTIRTDLVVEVFQKLLEDHPLYNLHDQNAATEAIRDVLFSVFSTRPDEIANSGTGQPSKEHQGERDHFTRHCPFIDVIHSVILPDSEAVPACAEQLITLNDLMTRVGGAVYDLLDRAGHNTARNKEIQETDWVIQRLRHVHRNGLLNHPLLVFSILLKQEFRKLQSNLSFSGSLRRVAGSSQYYQQIAEDIAALDVWFGIPLFSVTASLNAVSDVPLATWVSHNAGTAGRPTQVWHKSSEGEELVLLPGREQPEEEVDTYFVHKKEDGATSCPFHVDCERMPVSVHRNR